MQVSSGKTGTISINLFPLFIHLFIYSNELYAPYWTHSFEFTLIFYVWDQTFVGKIDCGAQTTTTTQKTESNWRKQNLWFTESYFIRLCFCTRIHSYIAYQQWVGLGSFKQLYIHTVWDRRIERTMPVSAEYNCISIDIVFYRCNKSGNFSLDALRDVLSKALQVFPHTHTSHHIDIFNLVRVFFWWM